MALTTHTSIQNISSQIICFEKKFHSFLLSSLPLVESSSISTTTINEISKNNNKTPDTIDGSQHDSNISSKQEHSIDTNSSPISLRSTKSLDTLHYSCSCSHSDVPLGLSLREARYLVGAVPTAVKRWRNVEKDFLKAAARGCSSLLLEFLRTNDPVKLTDTIHPANGYTALHYAVQGGHVKCARLLLAAGAQTWVSAKDGLTPYQLAERREKNDMIEVFQQHNPTDQPKPTNRRNSCPAVLSLRPLDNQGIQASKFLEVDVKVYTIAEGPWYDLHTVYEILLGPNHPGPIKSYRLLCRFEDFNNLYNQLASRIILLPFEVREGLMSLRPIKSTFTRFSPDTLTTRCRTFKDLILLAAGDPVLNSTLSTFLLEEKFPKAA